MKTKINILSVDSGGVRNLISAYILQKIEEELQKTQNNSKLKIVDIFDTFVSVGSSSLLSYLYQIPDSRGDFYSAQQVMEHYKAIAAKIYNQKWTSYLKLSNTICSQQQLKQSVSNLFSNLENVKNSKNNIIPLYNLTNGEIEIVNAVTSDLTAEDLLNASLATSPFFKTTKINDTVFCSGEHISANPKYCLEDKIFKKAFSEYEVINILSIGAGSNTIQSTNNTIKIIAKDCATQFVEQRFFPNQTINYYRIDVPTKDFDVFKPLHTNSYIDFSKQNIYAMNTAGQLAMGALDDKEFKKFIQAL
ncbi:hypothetical protein [Flavobacterium sp.]|uniref:hypothetical protein n=1 Tax=Flavobacterium sp. TaxID=239 RepID=UPI00334028AF